jgi:histidinol phosphatase-like enzyme
MPTGEKRAVFFDIGGTLASAVLSPAGKLIELDTDPDVFPILERLKSRGIPLGIISNTGDETEASMRAVLEASHLFGYFEPRLLIYSSTLPKTDPKTKPPTKLKPKPDPSIFAYAAHRAGLDPSSCVFVGESRDERAGALAAGLRVAPHPRLAEDALEGVRLRYVRISPPPPRPGDEQLSWRDDLRERPLVPLSVAGPQGDEVLAIVGAGTAAQLYDAGYIVTPLGAPDAPLTTDVYLLRDDAQVASGFLTEEGNASQFFGAEPAEPAVDVREEPGSPPAGFVSPGASESPSDWVLGSDSTGKGLLVALPAGRSVEEFHFRDARHGHNLKLVPSLRRLKPFAAGGGGGTEGFAGADFLSTAPPDRALTDLERSALDQIDGPLIASYVDRFAGLAPLAEGEEAVKSRHIRHPDNARVVAAAAADLEALGLTVRLRRFSHEGRFLENVEAVLPGRSEEAILVTAHIDSTAASGGPGYRPARDPAPGADDDASGVAAVISIARVLTSLAREGPFQRSARFVLFNAEEQGLVGSQVYAASAADRNDSIVAVFQMDMVGFIGSNMRVPRPFEIHVGHDRPEVVQASAVLADLLTRLQPVVATELMPPQVYTGEEAPSGDPAAGRSDHASFQDHGYPACVLSEDFFSGPRPGDPAPQANPDYHKPTDRVVEYGYAAQIARCIGAASLVLLEPQSAPESTPGDGRRRRNGRKDVNSNPPRGERTMAGGIDLRDQILARRSKENISEHLDRFVAEISESNQASGESGEPVQVEGYNALTRTPHVIIPPPGFGAEGAAGDRIGQALSLAAGLLSSAGFEAGEAPTFTADPAVGKTSGGAEAVYLHQYYRGVPIFEMSRRVRFDADGNPMDLVGDHVPAIDPSFEIRPAIGPVAALTSALEVIESGQADVSHADPYQPQSKSRPPEPPDLGGYKPVIAAYFDDLPSRPVVFERGNLGATIPGSLTVFQLEKPRLGWYFKVTTPQATRQYEVVVSADKAEPEILYAKESTVMATGGTPSGTSRTSKARTGATAAPRLRPGTGISPSPTSTRVRGTVFRTNPGTPPTQPTEVDFPLPVSEYPLENPTVPSGFPRPWVTQNQTVGPNVVALLGDRELTDQNSTVTRQASGGQLIFRPTGNPTPQQILNNDDQKVINIFYFCNYMHDFFYMLGFDEAAGNFQGDDPVLARAHPQAVFGTANMLTLPEHQSPTMNMGMVEGINRHTAMDADVVFHEFVHGVSNRLVGGPMNTSALRAQQSGSMGEGWGDYFALTIQTYDRADDEAERVTTGDWVTNRPGVGIRMHRYTADYPANYGDMRTNRIHDAPDCARPHHYQEVHNAGEIWCATLMQINRALGEALGDRKRGIREAWQIVVDSFKLCPINPSFLDARDAMFAALDARQSSGALSTDDHAACWEAMWQTFAGFGMGAQAPRRGSRFADAQSDFHLPDDLGGEEVPARFGQGALVGAADESSPGFLDPNERVPGPTEGGEDDPDLQSLLRYWNDLSDRDRGYILAKVEQMVGGEEGTTEGLERRVASARPARPLVPPGATLST